MASPIFLLDSMIVIEAVRTGCWNAITGQHRVVTVKICEEELLRGDASVRGYTTVTPEDLARVVVEPVPPLISAKFRLLYPDADGMDEGERDLMAHAASRTDAFLVCSCDKSAVRAAHVLGWMDRVVSLEWMAAKCGARPNPALRQQFTEARLSEWRTKLQLGVRI